MSRISQAEILQFVASLHAAAAAAAAAPILREREARALTEQNTPSATSPQSPQTRAQSGPAFLLGNYRDLPQADLGNYRDLPQADLGNYRDLPQADLGNYRDLPQADLDPALPSPTDPMSLYDIVDECWGEEEKKIKRDAEGLALLQSSADTSIAHNLIGEIKNLMNNQKLTYSPGLASCGTQPIPARVNGVQLRDSKGKIVWDLPCIHCYDTPRQKTYNFVGLQHCSSPLRCPVCGRKITFVRRIQVSWGVRRLLKEGFICTMMTLTAPHTKKSNPKKFIDMFCEAKRILQKSAPWKKITKKLEYIGQIAGSEITVDAPWSTNKTGIHFHSHNLLFFKNFSDKEEVCKIISEAWTKSCMQVGLVSETNKKDHLTHGFDLSLANPDNKNGEITAEQAADYIAKSVSFEISPAPGSKTGRKPTRLNQWQLMRLATSTHPELVPELDIVLQALHGRRAMYWSKGLQTHCNVPSVETILKVLYSYSKNLDKSVDFESAVEAERANVEALQNENIAASETDIEIETEDNTNTENLENEKITAGEEGEEIIQISLQDWAVIKYYNASQNLLKALSANKNLSFLDAQRIAKNAIYLIGLGIDPVDGTQLTSRGQYMYLINQAQRDEARRASVGLENPECIHLGPPLIAPEQLQALIAKNQQTRAAAAPTLEQLF